MSDVHCVSERIKRVLMERICDGTYAPGHRLVELQIAREFDTSQAPIREALCKLEVMRFVETEPYKGTRVREVSSTEFAECLKIRGALESLAVEQASKKLNAKVAELTEKARLTVEAARNGDAKTYGIANLDFHRIIVAASENQTLLHMWDQLAVELRMLSCAQGSCVSLDDCANEHLDIVDAIAEGDYRFAAKLLNKHVETVLVYHLQKHSIAQGRTK